MTDLEKRADEYVSNKADKGNFDVEKFGRAYFSESSMKQALINFAKAETALLSQHILDLQKDKGNLTDRVRELEQQIEKMKKYIKACWVEENLNDYSSYITNTSDEFRDLVKELNEEIRNGR
jgi:predicted  nucleic acid-binding Zn-ribbon protein